RPGLRVDWHRATMAHLQSVYPFHADEGFGERGPYLGVNVTGGMSGFWFDPFELYQAGLLSNPNCLVMGELGAGKSATVKAFLGRSLAVYGPRRFVAIVDPKGEYGPFAAAHGLPVIRLHPGGTDRLNPMDPRPGEDATNMVARQSLAAGLVTGVLGRPLDVTEDALLGWAVTTLARTGRPFTLNDVTATVADPPDELVALSRRTPLELSHAATPVVFALDKLATRTLAGMFDGPTTVNIDWDHGAGFVIDLSAIYNDRQVLPLVMLAATSWLSAVLQRPNQRRVIQVIDEAWAAVRHGAHHFQGSLKLARTYGVSTWLICHRPADLTAQADDGTADAKIAAGLLSDMQTRIVFRQPVDQAPVAAELLGLTQRETRWVSQLVKGRALWKLQERGAVVHTVLTETEKAVFDTDRAMNA
ncbi:MAG: ATP-binding protein, partial [Actinomycetota bacterium]|nr:ATP-binding protein [Actinomycetota bacterium]